jgi:hypothetical protein
MAAKRGSSRLKVRTTPDIGFPLASYTVASRVVVPPGLMESGVALRATEAGVWVVCPLLELEELELELQPTIITAVKANDKRREHVRAHLRII